MELKLADAAGSTDREQCPVRVALPELTQGKAARLYEAASGDEVVCQSEPGEVAFLVSGLPRGSVRHYRLAIEDRESASAKNSIGLKDTAGEALEITIGGELFTRYNYASRWTRPFFHPVMGPGGKRVTRSFPMEERVEG